uniref:Uncharacterized protein n=1 Tax=Glossina pallidipes TaxID=7398 RepID=A0A1B0AJ88_GLOPL
MNSTSGNDGNKNVKHLPLASYELSFMLLCIVNVPLSSRNEQKTLFTLVKFVFATEMFLMVSCHACLMCFNHFIAIYSKAYQISAKVSRTVKFCTLQVNHTATTNSNAVTITQTSIIIDIGGRGIAIAGRQRSDGGGWVASKCLGTTSYQRTIVTATVHALNFTAVFHCFAFCVKEISTSLKFEITVNPKGCYYFALH